MTPRHPFAPGAIERTRNPNRLLPRLARLLDRTATVLVWAFFIAVMCCLAVMAAGLLVIGVTGFELFPGARLL